MRVQILLASPGSRIQFSSAFLLGYVQRSVDQYNICAHYAMAATPNGPEYKKRMETPYKHTKMSSKMYHPKSDNNLTNERVRSPCPSCTPLSQNICIRKIPGKLSYNTILLVVEDPPIVSNKCISLSIIVCINDKPYHHVSRYIGSR
jgi:hypothetical protein